MFLRPHNNFIKKESRGVTNTLKHFAVKMSLRLPLSISNKNSSLKYVR